MSKMLNKPVILVNIANNNIKPLRSLMEEGEMIRKLFLLSENSQSIHLNLEPFATIESMIESLVRYKDKVEIFHFSGYDNNQILLLDGNDDIKKSKRVGLSHLLSNQDSIRLVFLNRSTTQKQVEQLLDAGIPAVIAISKPIDDKNSFDFTKSFYQCLANSYTIQEAFEIASAIIHTQSDYSPTIYRSINEQQGELPWGLYIKDNKILNYKPIIEKKSISLNTSNTEGNSNVVIQGISKTEGNVNINVSRKENNATEVKGPLIELIYHTFSNQEDNPFKKWITPYLFTNDAIFEFMIKGEDIPYSTKKELIGIKLDNLLLQANFKIEIQRWLELGKDKNKSYKNAIHSSSIEAGRSIMIGDGEQQDKKDSTYLIEGIEKEIPLQLTTILNENKIEIFGRDLEVRNIVELLNSNDKATLLYGVGGIGKTITAQYFISEYRNNYHYVAWLDVTTDVQASFIENLELIDSLNLRKDIENIGNGLLRKKEVFNLILHRFSQLKNLENKKNLIIIDNVRDSLEDIEAINRIANLRNWTVLILSRQRIQEFNSYGLMPLDSQSAIELFYENSFYSFGQNSKLISLILNKLNNHPLSIKIVARTAQLSKLSLKEVLARLENIDIDFWVKTFSTITADDNQNLPYSIEFLSSFINQGSFSEKENTTLRQLVSESSISFPLSDSLKNKYNIENQDEENDLIQTLTSLVRKGLLTYDDSRDTYTVPDLLQNITLTKDDVITQNYLREIKLSFLGQAGVGKTSLINRIITKDFNEQESKTEGIKINEWHTTIQDTSIKVNIWDFGGQDIYYSTHTIFITKRTVHVIVVESRINDDFGDRDLENWIKMVDNLAPNAPIIIVINKSDVHIGDFPKNKMKRTYPQIIGFVETSCKENENIDLLIDKIKEAVLLLDLFSEKYPSSYLEIIKKVRNLNKDFIEFHDFFYLCKQVDNKLDKIRIENIMRLMHDLGIMLNIRDNKKIENTHVLEPTWVTNGIFKIISSKQLAINKGHISKEEAFEVLDKEIYPSLRECEFILDMMEHFNLCYKSENHKDRYFIPSSFSKDEPVDFNWDNTQSLKLHLNYEFSPSTILSRFIVRMNHLIKENLIWRSGVVIKDENFNALITIDGIAINIEVVGENDKREFLYFIRRNLLDVHQTLGGIKFKELYPIGEINNKTVFIPKENLLNAKNNNRNIFYHPELNQDIDVEAILSGIEPASFASLRDLVIENKIEEALKIVQRLFNNENEIVLYLSRMNELKQKIRRNTISEESASIEMNKLRENVLIVINELKKQ